MKSASKLRLGSAGRPRRIPVAIELSNRAGRKLGKVCAKRGMRPAELCQRLIEWLAVQPKDVKAAVLGDAPIEDNAQIVRRIMAQIRRDGNSIARTPPLHPNVLKHTRA